MLKCNVGKQERILRIVVGIAFLAIPELLPFSFWATGAVYLIGAIGLTTGILAYCPAWHLLGKNTCERNSHESHSI